MSDTRKTEPDAAGGSMLRLVRLKELLGDVQAASLTASKTDSIIQRGCYRGDYRISGFVLCNEQGDRCLVEMSAVRWLDKDEMWWLMHESESPLNKTNDSSVSTAAQSSASDRSDNGG